MSSKFFSRPSKIYLQRGLCFSSDLSSNELVGAGTSSGIEHALKFQEIGKNHKQDLKDYKCNEYLHFSTYSFYDKEVSFAFFKKFF